MLLEGLLPNEWSVRQHKHVILQMSPSRVDFGGPFYSVLFRPSPNPAQTPAIDKQLNSFAGQLYTRTYEEYESLYKQYP
jgi:hypothetical protein